MTEFKFFAHTHVWKNLYNKSTKTDCAMCVFGFKKGTHRCWQSRRAEGVGSEGVK